MLRPVLLSFLGLVGLYFIVRNPDEVVLLLQAFINAAQSLANDLARLRLSH